MKAIISGLVVLLAFFNAQGLESRRTVMVQLFEWPWNDIARECELYLAPNGFSAVQISPPNEHLSLPQSTWWERYQPVSHNLISRSGTEAEFKKMVQRCKKVGIDIYVDTVINHMTAFGSGKGFSGVGFSKYNYENLFSPMDFHYCGRYGDNGIRNFTDRFEVQFCELLGLADLKTESDYVRMKIVEFMNHLTDLGVAGFRIDAAKHIPASDLKEILKKLKARPYIMTETFVGFDDVISLYEYTPFSDVHLFPYAYEVGASVKYGQVGYLPSRIAHYPDSRSAVVFLENHDLQRIGSDYIVSLKNDPLNYFLSYVFMLTWPYGYPKIFSGYDYNNFDQAPPHDSSGQTLPILDPSGQCRAPWLCEHRYPGFNQLIYFRNSTDDTFYASRVQNPSPGLLAFSRGNKGFVAINKTSNQWSTQLDTDLPDGIYCDLITQGQKSECPKQFNVYRGHVTVEVAPNSAIILLNENPNFAFGNN